MYCKKCGKEIGEAAFCPYCGEKAEAEKGKGTAGKNGKGYIVILGIAAAAVLCVGAVSLTKAGKSKSEKFAEYIDAGNYTEAQNYYDEVLAADSQEEEKVYQITCEKIDHAVEEYYAGRITYEEAYGTLEPYTGFYPTEVLEAENELNILRESNDNFEQAAQKYAQGDYQEAGELYRMVIEAAPNYEEAQEKAEDCTLKWKEAVLSEAQTCQEAGDYGECMQLLEGLAAEMPEDEQITGQIDAVTKVYEEEVTAQVNELITAKDYETGRALLSEAMMIFPENENLKALSEKVEGYFPVYLQDISLFDSNLPGTRNIESSPKDMYQNQYTMGILYYDTSYQDGSDNFNTKERKETYLLNREYKHFTGMIASSEKWGKSQYTAVFTIYGDGVPLFSTEIGKDSKPVAIDLDVTGIEKLDIAFFGGYEGYFLLADPCLYRQWD